MDGYQVDELRLYLGDGIKIANGITLFQPTIGEIASYGEADYFSMAQTICATPSSMKVVLDDMGLNWMKIEDFQLFMMLCQSLTPDKTKPLLGDLDLTKFKPICYDCDGHGYYTLGEKVGQAFFDGLKLK
jgi:hypothetical protein